MRVSNRIIAETTKFQLNQMTEELNRANMVVATQKRILRIGDDPVGLTQALNMKSTLSNLEQLSRDITMGKSWLAASESAQRSIQGVVMDMQELTVQMASGNVGASERQAAGQTVQQMLEEVVGLVNTQVNGRYIFAGTKTDSAAYTLNGDNSVTYNGDSNAFSVKVGRSSTMEVGADGQDVFQPSGAGANDDIFVVLADLKTALEGNDIPSIQNAMSDLETFFNHINGTISNVGSKMLRMDMKDNVLYELNAATTERLSRVEDAELTSAITDLKAREVAYQAALAASARVLNLSLVNYL